jgi:predicted MFS family arabinose efflux permease
MPPSAPFRTMFAGILALAIAMGIGRFAFTPLLPLMREERLLTVTEGGFLASVHFLGYWLGALGAARIAWSPKWTLRLSLLAIGAATLAMGLTERFALWLVLRWLAGVCSAFTLVIVGSYTVRRLAEAGQAHRQGLVFSGVGAGITFAGLGTLALMAEGIGSMASWQIFGTASLAGCAAVLLMAGAEIPHVSAAARQARAPRTPLMWSAIVAYGAAGLGYIIPATYLPVMARDSVPSPFIFGWSWPVFGAAALLSTLLSTRLFARAGNRQIWAVSQAVMAAGLLAPALYPHLATVIIAGLCVGGTFMIITVAGLGEAHRIAPNSDVQRHIAILTAAFATGQMVGPVVAGWAYDATGSFSPLLIVTSLVLIATAVSIWPRADRDAQA